MSSTDVRFSVSIASGARRRGDGSPKGRDAAVQRLGSRQTSLDRARTEVAELCNVVQHPLYSSVFYALSRATGSVPRRLSESNDQSRPSGLTHSWQ